MTTLEVCPALHIEILFPIIDRAVTGQIRREALGLTPRPNTSRLLEGLFDELLHGPAAAGTSELLTSPGSPEVSAYYHGRKVVRDLGLSAALRDLHADEEDED